MKKPVILLGAGGHAKVCLDILKLNDFPVLGFTAPESLFFQQLLYLGNDESIYDYPAKEILLVNGIGSIGNPKIRMTLFNQFQKRRYQFLTLIHPSAIIAKDAVIADGVQVMAGAVIQPNVVIGANTIINTRASIDHDCKIASHVHIAPGVTLSGSVEVNEEVHIGTGANVIQNIKIGKKSIIGSGSLVLKNVPCKKKVVGVPAQEVE